jgi:hypothetical protein
MERIIYREVWTWRRDQGPRALVWLKSEIFAALHPITAYGRASGCLTSRTVNIGGKPNFIVA